MKKEFKVSKSTKVYFVLIVVASIIGGTVGAFSQEISEAYGLDIDGIFRVINSPSSLVMGLFVFLITIYTQIIIHELGHCIGGLLSGYRFRSFSVGKYVLMKEDGKFRIGKLYMHGISGQCIMVPPDMVNGKYPFVLYNLGGPLINLLTVPVFGIIAEHTSHPVSDYMYMMALVGLLNALINGIPMRLSMVNNDGYNLVDLIKSKKASYVFWLSLRIAEKLAKGLQIKDMPEDWIHRPDESYKDSSIACSMFSHYNSKLMEEKRFDEALEVVEEIIKLKKAPGIHKSLAKCDKIYILAVLNHSEKGLGDISKNQSKYEKINCKLIDEIYSDKNQKSFMKHMASFPSVLRTEYTYALVCQKDIEKAKSIRQSFDTVAKSYPYKGDLDSERELMDYADSLFNLTKM